MTLTGLTFLVAFFVCCGLALLRNPLYGLYTYVAVFYLHPPSRWWGESLPDLRWSFLAAGVTLTAIILRQPGNGRPSWLSPLPVKLIVAFTVWFWAVSLWALDTGLHVQAAILLSKYLLVIYMIWKLLDTPDKVTNFLLAHLAGCFYLSVLAYGADSAGRLDGVGGPGIDDSNTLGMQVATGAIVGSMLSLHLTGWRKLFCFVAIAFCLNTVVLTGSRGAFLAVLAGGLVLVYLRPRKYRGTFLVYAVLGVLAFGAVASKDFWERMNTVSVAVEDIEEADTSAQSRIALLKAQVRMWAAYPFGTGQRGTEILSPNYLEERFLARQGNTAARSSHNVFMTVLVEQGVPGALLFIWLVAWTGLALRRVRKSVSSGDDGEKACQVAAVAAALTVILVGGVFADFSKCEAQIWMMAVLSLLIRPGAVAAPANAAAVRPLVYARG